ncbi:acyltransferase family protein [Altererythrobacter xixiisoli]|uniref:Acyltransferase family protein n=1 Tax=Croceibacterium xixiisoli TaxID=1476466 RepID=A0A6I4TX52_9SPHN|nr:acyltransferase [Croceibacterium xixiisoli]MXO99218.1 acyltransferase family protein [Croceibacterium xixiisoli]
MLKSVQMLRGLAALLVLLFHTHLIVGRDKYLDAKPFGDGFAFGYVGVDIFFVLSGFIILTAHCRDIDQPDRLPRYLYRRWARLYPIYWVYLAGVIGLMLLGVGDQGRMALGNLASSLLLIKFVPEAPPLSVAWSLFHEVMFYAFFALLIVNRRLGIAAFVLWYAAVAAGYVLGWSTTFEQHQGFVGVFTSLFNLNFVLGMGAWYLLQKRTGLPGWGYLLTSLPLFVLGIWEISAVQGQDEWRLAFALGSALLLLGVVALEREGRIAVPDALMKMGDASYSIYLLHTPILSAAIKIVMLAGLQRVLPAGVIFVILALVSLVGSYIGYLLLERPLLGLLRNHAPARAR